MITQNEVDRVASRVLMKASRDWTPEELVRLTMEEVDPDHVWPIVLTQNERRFILSFAERYYTFQSDQDDARSIAKKLTE